MPNRRRSLATLAATAALALLSAGCSSSSAADQPGPGVRSLKRIDAARAAAIEDNFARWVAAAPDRFREQTPAQDSRDGLLRVIADLQREVPSYARMSPQLAEALVRQLAFLQHGGDHAHHRTAGGEGAVGEGAHQPGSAAPEDQPPSAAGEQLPEGPGGVEEARVATGTRSAKDANAGHTVYCGNLWRYNSQHGFTGFLLSTRSGFTRSASGIRSTCQTPSQPSGLRRLARHF